MLIVDAQVHIWGSGTPLPPHRPTSVFSKDELLAEMDAAGVDAAVIHPPGWDPGSDRLALEAARQHPDRLAVLGKFPLDRPESRALIDGWTRQPGMLGLRFVFLQPHQKSWPTDGTLDWLWPAAERAGVPLALLAADFLPLVGQVAERHPGLKLIVDHLGRPHRTKDEAAWANLSELLALARHPERGGQGDGRAELLERALSLPEPPSPSPPAPRGLRARAPVLGDGHHAHALHLAAVRDPVHRGAPVAHHARQGADHGPRPLRVARLEAARVRRP